MSPAISPQSLVVAFAPDRPPASDAGGRRPPTAGATLALLLTLGVAGCATTANPDPIEPVNRKVFAFNEGVDKVVLKPVARAYEAVLPQPVRKGVSNFFSNLGDPWSSVNLMLQGRFTDGLSDLGRFGTNTTVGLLGLVDVASDWGMPRHGESFSSTLGAWGVGPGAYIVLPLLGPSDTRGVASIPINSMGSLQGQIADVGVRNSLTALNMVDKRASFLDVSQRIDEMALDKYLFVRDAYIQRRDGKRADADPKTKE